jgi:antitoxin component of RelBE/YafQ-DinJ toxin-antitoxin module
MNPRENPRAKRTKIGCFRLDEKTWEVFVSLVTERGLTPSEVLRRFVAEYVEKHGGDKKR